MSVFPKPGRSSMRAGTIATVFPITMANSRCLIFIWLFFLFPLKMKSLELLWNFYWEKKEVLWAKIEANVFRGKKLKRWSRLAGEQTMAYGELCIHLWFQSLRRSWVVTILNVHFNYKKISYSLSLCVHGIRLGFKVWICHDMRQDTSESYGVLLCKMG